MKSLQLGAFFLTSLSFATQARAQTASKPCPPLPKARNTQEAVMMEQSSINSGCWVRNSKTGQLEFVANSPTDNKPILNPRSKPPPVQLAGDAVGRWKITSTNNLLQSYWEKGTLVISTTLGLQWNCEQSTSFDLGTLKWVGPVKACVNSGTTLKKLSGACDWKLTKLSPGTYHVQCASSETFLTGTIVVQANTMTGKVVDRSDSSLVMALSFSGSRSVPLPVGQ